MKPESVEMPTRDRYAAADNAARDDGANEAMLRRRARIMALGLMALSGIFVIAIAVGAWFLLHG